MRRSWFAQLCGQLLGLLVISTPVHAQIPDQNAYVLGIGDEIEVTVFGPNNEGVKTRIKEDGTIVVPHLGTIVAQGRTARTLGKDIGNGLERGGFYVNPIVKVDVLTFVSNTVTVAGHVATPGLVPVDRAMSVGMVVARSGGIRADGADFALLTRKDTAIPVRVSLNDVTLPEQGGNTPVRPGDTLVVPQAPIVYVYGQVNSPGGYPIREGMTIRQAIARAGGPTLAGSERSVRIYRGGVKIKKVDLNALVEADDTLRVNEKIF